MKERVLVPGLPEPKVSYCRCVKNGNMVFIAGTGAFDPSIGKLNTGDMYTQAKLTALNVKATIEAAGGTLEDLCQLTVFISDYDEYAEYNRAVDEVFKDVVIPPTRATVQVARMLGGIKVEMMGIAIINK